MLQYAFSTFHLLYIITYSSSVIFNYPFIVHLLSRETPKVFVARIKERVRKCGHHVPERDKIRHFYRSIINFWKIYKDMVDRWYLISDSTQQFIEVALRKGKDYSISEEMLFNSFSDNVGEKDER